MTHSHDTASDWRDHARCLTADPELFFVDWGKNASKAKAICARCPVRQECLAFAIRTNSEFGIFGGTNEKERRAIRQGRAA